MMPIGTRVKIVDDVDKPHSLLIGKEGKIVGFKWNKFRLENNLPIVQLDSGQTVSGWSLWYSQIVNKKEKK